jgi:hypothetical protein
VLDATVVMKQAGVTAKTWMTEAAKLVEERFAAYPPEAKASLIAAYMAAAAGDEIAMHIRGLVEATEELPDAISGLREALRSDHPLQGETLEGIESALRGIAESIDNAGS